MGSSRLAVLRAVLPFLAVLAAGAQESEDPGAAAAASSSTESLERRPYTWWDGDRALEAFLQPDMVVVGEDAADDRGDVVGTIGADVILRLASPDESDGLPVFRASSGALMTLPGGIVLVLDSNWDDAETASFFRNQGIAAGRVSPLGAVPNGFVVEADPGFPSLELANGLAGLAGVRSSSPDWLVERRTN